MPAFAGPSRPDSAATSAAWVEATLNPSDRVERLGSLQPEAGLLWVARGQVTVHSSKKSEELQKGSVVAYRLGGSLGWSAREGALVRWCARDVRVAPGEARRWTEDLALQLPALKSPPRKQGRGPAALVVLAVVAVGALGAAWVHTKGVVTPAQIPSEKLPPTPASSTEAQRPEEIEKLKRFRREALARIGARVLEDAGLPATSSLLPPSGEVFTCRLAYPPGSPDLAAALFTEAAQRIFGEAPWVRIVRAIFEGQDEAPTFAILVVPTGESSPD